MQYTYICICTCSNAYVICTYLQNFQSQILLQYKEEVTYSSLVDTCKSLYAATSQITSATRANTTQGVTVGVATGQSAALKLLSISSALVQTMYPAEERTRLVK